jgi:hypothetical protein
MDGSDGGGSVPTLIDAAVGVLLEEVANGTQTHRRAVSSPPGREYVGDFGDFGIYDNSLVVSAESNNWDFVMRLTYGSSGGVATVLVASPASDGLSASPE